jgi:hypothetical protein
MATDVPAIKNMAAMFLAAMCFNTLFQTKKL